MRTAPFAARFAAALLAGLSLAALAAPQPPVELIARSVFFGNPTRFQALLSPDGRWISWIAPRDGVLNVWAAPSGDLSKAKPLTEEKTRPIREHFWAKNSQLILFVNDRGGDEDFLLYGVSPEGGPLRSFTPFKKTRVIPIRSSRAHPDEMLIGLNNRVQQFHDVHRLNLVTGELKLVYENNEFSGFEADDDLRLRLATKERPGGATEVLRFDDGKTEPFGSIPAEDSITTSTVSITGDGKTIYWLDSRGRDKAALVAQDLATGATRVLAENAKADVVGVLQNPVTRAAEAYEVNYLRNDWYPIGDAIRDDVKFLNARVARGQWNVVSRDDADDKWVVMVDEIVKPISYYLYDRKSSKFERLFVTRPELEGKPLAPMYGVEIKARDGLTLPSFVTLPVGTSKGSPHPGKPLPMVLVVHGGPWAQDVFGYRAEPQWLANRGYAVLQVNYRGSTGFGKAFVEAANRQFAGKMHDDLIDAVKWAIGNGIAQPDKIAIYGGSYGGYATLVGVTFTPEQFACGVDIVGPSNLVSLIESFPEYWKPFMESTWYRRVGNPSNPKDREDLLARSPLTRVGDIKRPLLIAQGANDPRVTRKESDTIAAAMEAKKIPVTYVLYADEGHGFARPENRVSFYAISEAFLGKCLGGRNEAMPAGFPGAQLSVSHGIDVVPGLRQAVAQ